MEVSTNSNQASTQASNSKARAKRPGNDQMNSAHSRKSQRTSVATDAALAAHLASASTEITIINDNRGSSAANPINYEESFIFNDDDQSVDMEQFDKEWTQREDVLALNAVSIDLPIC